MNEPPRDHPEQSSEPGDRLRQQVRTKEERKLRARREKHRTIWFGLGMFGMIGWSVAVPAVLATLLGVWIDKNYPSEYSWTLMLLILGVGLGCWNAWNWIQKESHDETGERR